MTTNAAVSRRTQPRTPRTRRPNLTLVAPPPQEAALASETAHDTIYVYLDNGQVAVVRNVSSMETSDRTFRLLRDGQTVAEYRRSDVFCASRELISPPFSC